MTRRLRTIIRVTDPEATIRFFELIGLKVVQRMESEKGRYTLIFLAADKDIGAPGRISPAEIELTYNWGPQRYHGEWNLGRLAYRMKNIYETCRRLAAAGVAINQPPRDGHMATNAATPH